VLREGRPLGRLAEGGRGRRDPFSARGGGWAGCGAGVWGLGGRLGGAVSGASRGRFGGRGGRPLQAARGAAGRTNLLEKLTGLDANSTTGRKPADNGRPARRHRNGSAIMHQIRIRRSTAVALAALVGLAGTTLLLSDAQAQSPLQVSATVAGACTLAVPTPLAFGTYVAGQLSPKDGQAIIQYNCASGLNISIMIDQGLSANGSQRQMINGSDVLRYAIFKESSRTTAVAWGINGTDPLTITSTPGGAQDVDVFGRIDAVQSSPPGSYTDTLQVSLVVN
jgi:spore coat protein U-like protein